MDRIVEIKVCGNHITKDNKYAGVKGEANVTKLRISFDIGWEPFAKKITFWNALGENPVAIILLPDYVENPTDGRTYLVPIPAEPLMESGMLTFVIEGSLGNKVQRSISDRLEVKDAPVAKDASAPVEPTPDELAQVKQSIEAMKKDILKAVQAEDNILKMTVSSESLPTGAEASVQMTKGEEAFNLHFSLPAGGKGNTGDSGVYIGESVPTDPKVGVWINPKGKEVGDVGYGSLMTSITSFGAMGDGKTDDTAALKAAAACGGAVFFPAGTYLLFEQIDMTADINWIGVGGKSIIKLMPCDQSRPEEHDGATVYSCSMIHHPDGDQRYSISLQGIVMDANMDDYELDIYGNGSSLNDRTKCLELHNPKSVYLNNVETRNALLDGCYIQTKYDDGSWECDGITKIDVSNSRFVNNGTYLSNGIGLHIEGDGSNTHITNCGFNENSCHGFVLGDCMGTNVSNISCCSNGYGGVCLLGGSSLNTLTGVYCADNLYGVILKANFSPSLQDDDYDESRMGYAQQNNIVGLSTLNYYGVVFCNCDNSSIIGWQCYDSVAYYIGYGNATKDITGLVVGVLSYTEKEMEYDIESIDKFKIQFLVR